MRQVTPAELLTTFALTNLSEIYLKHIMPVNFFHLDVGGSKLWGNELYGTFYCTYITRLYWYENKVN
jgi:hypothetical protein